MMLAYGSGVLGRPPSYEEYVGLWLNLPRALTRQSWVVAAALCAGPRAGMPPEWARAVAATEAQGAELAFQLKMAARARAALEKGGPG